MTSIAAIGVDTGGTNVRVCAVDSAMRPVGEVVKAAWRAPRPEGDVASLAATLDRLIRDVTGTSAAEAGLPVGMGLAAMLSSDGRIVRNAPNIGWRDVALAAALESELGLPLGGVSITNDVNAILQGEIAAGAARGSRVTLAVYWGTGIGGAMALEGRVIAGAGGNCGEIGHVKVGGDARCGCGEVGCFEATCGGAALLRRADAAVARGEASDLGGPGDVHPGRIDEAARAGHPWADALWREVSERAGRVIGNVVTVWNPDVLVLGGGVLDGCPALRERVGREILARSLAVARDDLKIVSGTLGEEAGVLGGAALALSR